VYKYPVLSNLKPDSIRLEIQIRQVTNPINVEFEVPVDRTVVCTVDQTTRNEMLQIDRPGDTLRMHINGKLSSDTVISADGTIIDDACVSVNNVWVDNILIEKWALFRSAVFRPRLRSDQHGLAHASEIHDEWFFYFNGTLEIDLEDFYPRYYRVLLSGLDHYNHWVRESHMGMIDPAKLQELEDILRRL
jgi:hypothetical protein